MRNPGATWENFTFPPDGSAGKSATEKTTKFHELHEDRLAVPPSSCIASLTLYTVCDRINFRVIRGKSFRSRFFPWRLRPNLSRGFAPCSKAPTEKRRRAGHYQF